MRCRVVVVMLVSFLVSSVISLTDLEDNVVPEDNLQDLIVRTKKSPVEDGQRTPSEPVSKSDLELKAVLTEDIKRKIEDLKELKNAYRKVEADFFGSESQNLKSSVENVSSELLHPESKTPSEDSDNEPVRTARQYFPSSSSDKQYQSQKYDNKRGMFPDSSFSNGKYQTVSSHSKDSLGDRDAPYIAHFNPSSRTFGADGALKFLVDLQDLHKVADIKPELPPVHTPVISIQPVDLALSESPGAPTHIVPPAGNIVLPASLPTVTVSEHKPHEDHKPHEEAVHPHKKPDTKVPLYYEKKEIGKPGMFFSKQIIYGPSQDFGEGYSYPYTSYSSSPHKDVYSGYSSYPQGYPYGGSPYSYWYATDREGSSPGYSSYSDAQVNYNHAPAYSPGYSYQQGPVYYPAGGAYRSHRDLSSDFQKYQDEFDNLLSQFFRADFAGDVNSASLGNQSSVDKLKEDIEKEQKKIKLLQEELNTPLGSSDGSGVGQSFVDWLSKEIDAVYSRWIHLKDDITKSVKDSAASAKDIIKDSVKV